MKHPGQANSLDALCKRYEVDRSRRDFHGALLDAELLAQVYLKMTGGQAQLFKKVNEEADKTVTKTIVFQKQRHLKVIRATAAELASHEQWNNCRDGVNRAG
jgi:DNA polymerase-3 subunit epsilon